MSAARTRRRFLTWERYNARCRRAGGRYTNRRDGISLAHATWYGRAQYQGRWAPNGIRDVRLTGWT